MRLGNVWGQLGMSCKEWKETTLGEVVDKVIDYRGKTPKKLDGDWSAWGYRALSAKNIKTGKIVQQETIRCVNEELYKKWMKDEVAKNDILITSEAPFGEVYFWNTDEKIVLSQRLFALRSSKNVYAKFLYYYMTTYAYQQELRNRATGTTVIGLRQPELLKTTIKYPSIPEQKAIADTLSCLDDKIELNNRMNQTLEEMAQALFKSWFVDFEPFQDGEFVESELGMIPKGWRTGTLSDIGTIVGGSTPSKAKDEYYTNNGIAWITPKDLSINKNKFITRGEIDITPLGLKNSSAKILPEGTVLFSSRAPIGYMGIANGEVTTNQGFKSIVPNVNIGSAYIYYFLKCNLGKIENMASGSTFKEMSGTAMKAVEALIPDNGSLSKFNVMCNAIFSKQRALEKENDLLANIRDALLPKLMSGEIRVPVEVER